MMNCYDNRKQQPTFWPDITLNTLETICLYSRTLSVSHSAIFHGWFFIPVW